jgi:hypothetical protein
VTLVGEEVAVEFPDLRAHRLLGGAVGVGEGVELVDETLRMDPAQRVMSDIELSGVIAEDNALGEEAVRLDGAPKATLARRIGSGVTLSSLTPSPRRWSIQALASAKR